MSTTGSSSTVVSALDAAGVQHVSESAPPTSTKKEGSAAIYNPLPLIFTPHTPASNPFSDSSKLFPFSSTELCYEDIDLMSLSLQYLHHEAQRDHSPGD